MSTLSPDQKQCEWACTQGAERRCCEFNIWDQLRRVATIGVITLVVAALGFFYGQDHPRPGTSLTSEAAKRLERYDRLEETNQSLSAYVKSLAKRDSHLEEVLAEETSAVQPFEVGTEGETGETTITPLGLNLHVVSAYEVHSCMIEDPEDSEPFIRVIVKFNGKDTSIPTNGTWTRLDDLVEIRYSTSDGYLTFEYEDYDLGKIRKTRMYRFLETRVRLKGWADYL